METKAILEAVEAQAEWIAGTLRGLVEVESPSDNKAAVDAVAGLVARLAEGVGGWAKLHKKKDFGDVLEVRFGPARGGRKPILLLGHLDTVWPLGTLAKMPWRERDGRF